MQNDFFVKREFFFFELKSSKFNRDDNKKFGVVLDFFIKSKFLSIKFLKPKTFINSNRMGSFLSFSNGSVLFLHPYSLNLTKMGCLGNLIFDDLYSFKERGFV